MQRYYNIELLRFLCALTVAIYHWGLSFELMMMENNDTFRGLLNFHMITELTQFQFFLLFLD